MADTEPQWAIRVHTTMSGSPGPHVIECSSQRAARIRLEWWEANHPDARPELLRREVITTYGEWEAA